ncbi:flagellar basal body protein [Phenylobacterium montanum]|uniref:Flagellar basal body protein n=1 Tax=Phenylobacterium montanum TaxID=2823693 RepID=A0A975G349_9CAUL|nr:flagellar basal body protein [Caulobacter sp. S6]QUD89141.1 flagellar basal body protein [Caulobacter sp. S6]
MQPAPGQPDRIEPMIRLTQRLTELLALQAAAFEERRPQDAAASMDETTRLANAYRHEAQRLRNAPGEIERATADQRRRLRQATEAFDAVVARHGRALHAAKTVTEGLVHAIANEVARQRGANAGYGPRGVRNTGAASASITLNQRA